MIFVPLCLLSPLAGLNIITAVLALINGYNLNAYWPSTQYMEGIIIGLDICRGLAVLTTYLGAASLVPWIAAIYVIYVVVLGIIELRE